MGVSRPGACAKDGSRHRSDGLRQSARTCLRSPTRGIRLIGQNAADAPRLFSAWANSWRKIPPPLSGLKLGATTT
jgi:hypothetical protein